MDDNKQKELIMDEILIEEMQEISGGAIGEGIIGIKLVTLSNPPLTGAVYKPDLTLGGIIRGL